MKRNLNLSVELTTYQAIKKAVPTGQLSHLIDHLLKEYLRKQEKQKLIRGYQAMAKNKKLKAELAVWEETLADSYK